MGYPYSNNYDIESLSGNDELTNIQKRVSSYYNKKRSQSVDPEILDNEYRRLTTDIQVKIRELEGKIKNDERYSFDNRWNGDNIDKQSVDNFKNKHKLELDYFKIELRKLKNMRNF